MLSFSSGFKRYQPPARATQSETKKHIFSNSTKQKCYLYKPKIVENFYIEKMMCVSYVSSGTYYLILTNQRTTFEVSEKRDTLNHRFITDHAQNVPLWICFYFFNF